jgi:hypothetical protein
MNSCSECINQPTCPTSGVEWCPSHQPVPEDITPTQHSLDLLRKISETVKTWHHHHHILYDIASAYPEDYEVVYCEIGCWLGASSCLMLQRPSTKVIAIDAGPIKKAQVMENINRFNPHNNEFHYIYGNSRQLWTRERLEKITDKVDILFIDGSHSYVNCLRDFIEYQKYVRQFGFIVFDDYSDPGSPDVHAAVDDIFSAAKDWHVIGTFYNKFGARGGPEDGSGNCFVVRKLNQ